MTSVAMRTVVDIPLASLDVLLLGDSTKVIRRNTGTIAALMIYH
jgi:hypothetical protein